MEKSSNSTGVGSDYEKGVGVTKEAGSEWPRKYFFAQSIQVTWSPRLSDLPHLHITMASLVVVVVVRRQLRSA